MDEMIVKNKIQILENKGWIADSEKLQIVRYYHNFHYCNDNCVVWKTGTHCCSDDFNDVKINSNLLNRIYNLIKEDYSNKEKE